MATERRKGERVTFERGISAHMMGIDGTWRRNCVMEDISETGARLTVDYEPGLAVPAKVTFVSPEAQFTPKEVETKSEREKLVFRVKIQVPNDLVLRYTDRIKTGVRGVGYVRLDNSVAWPDWLDHLVGGNAAVAQATNGSAGSTNSDKSALETARR